MCVAAPMKVISVDREAHTAAAELGGNVLNVNIRLVEPKVGDYILVHAGCALEILAKEQAEEIRDLFAELEALNGSG